MKNDYILKAYVYKWKACKKYFFKQCFMSEITCIIIMMFYIIMIFDTKENLDSEQLS